MLTDRPDVPRIPFGRLNHKNGGWGGETHERAYNVNDNFSRGLHNTLIFANRGHLQLLEVNSRTFQPKMYFTADIGHFLVDDFKNGYYFSNNCKACTMGQFTVSRSTETPLRPDITPLYET